MVTKKRPSRKGQQRQEDVRLSVFVPRELVNRVKAHAARQGETVSQVVATWIDTQTQG